MKSIHPLKIMQVILSVFPWNLKFESENSFQARFFELLETTVNGKALMQVKNFSLSRIFVDERAQQIRSNFNCEGVKVLCQR